ncbi:U-box domain-containing protein 17-like [Primulina tabacum]|uniref:U-box domain-containing protein 17-like n=1 Tax=Primulina tabacum TaxID=48773 RepID=UPI003F59CBEA
MLEEGVQRPQRTRSGAVLRSGALTDSAESKEAALTALLNLAVKDEKCRFNAPAPIFSLIIFSSAILMEQDKYSQCRSLRTNYLLPSLGESDFAGTCSCCFDHSFCLICKQANNQLFRCHLTSCGNHKRGSPQVKSDAVMVLHNLSTHQKNLSLILEEQPIPSLVDMLKTCEKSSKTTEKCTALVESLVSFDEGRRAFTCEEGGILAVVEVLESGSPQSREHAVGALLTMCESDRSKYREPILKEGVIPGLLELTVQRMPKSQSKAQMLLRLLRDNP